MTRGDDVPCYTPYHPTAIEVQAVRALGEPITTQIATLVKTRELIGKPTVKNASVRAQLFEDVRSLYKAAVKVHGGIKRLRCMEGSSGD